MPFDKHLFISYAHIDNRPLSSEMQGWISRFHESLEAILSMRLGQDALIWRDTKLQGNDIFGDEIVQQFPKTALFISVLTPRYINSEWCTREIQEFCKIAKQTGGLVIDNKSRVFKVIKTPVEVQDSLPPEVRAALGYEFYTFDEDENPLELDPAFGKDLEHAYLRKLNTIAWDIVRILKRLGDTARAELPLVEQGAPSKPVVYLAECSYDQLEEREILEAELKAHGYTVLPDHHLPRLEADYVAQVERLLTQCKLSIHLIGQAYGMVPGGPRQESVIVLQNELAVQQSKAGVLQRVIWLPAGMRSTQEQQQRFIDAINQEAEAQFGADVITGELEELKAAVHDTLQRLEKPKPEKKEAHGVEDERPKMIYLICDERDRKNTIPLRKFLKARGFKVNIPLFSGDAETVHEAEKAHLSTCDAVLLFYGAGDEGWKFGRENDLKKMRAYRGEQPLPVSYTYLAEPMTDDKEELIEFEEPDLIDGLDGFSETETKAFVEAVNATKATP